MPIERNLPENQKARFNREIKAHSLMLDQIERARFHLQQAKQCGLAITLTPNHRPRTAYYDSLETAIAFLDSHEKYCQKTIHWLEKRLGVEPTDFSPEYYDEMAELSKAALNMGQP